MHGYGLDRAQDVGDHHDIGDATAGSTVVRNARPYRTTGRARGERRPLPGPHRRAERAPAHDRQLRPRGHTAAVVERIHGPGRRVVERGRVARRGASRGPGRARSSVERPYRGPAAVHHRVPGLARRARRIPPLRRARGPVARRRRRSAGVDRGHDRRPRALRDRGTGAHRGRALPADRVGERRRDRVRQRRPHRRRRTERSWT